MDNILLSIIIPAYNSGAFLSDTLNMLVSQNLDLCEVIIINDGSTDKTEEICRSFSSKYPAVSYITQENRGVSVARNQGLAQAKGRYVYFFDSDDSLTEGTLDFFREILGSFKKNVSIFSFGYEMVKNNILIKKYISSILDKREIEGDILQRSFFEKKLLCNICSCIYDRTFVLENKLLFTPNMKIGEDVEFIIKALSSAERLYYEKRICFVYQLRETSATQGYEFKIYDINLFNSFERRKDLILNLFSDHVGIKKSVNFFIANMYLSHLVTYLKSDAKETELNDRFYANKDLVYEKMEGRFYNVVLICALRIIPLFVLFKLFRKY